MADDKKNIPDAGKVDNPPEPGKVEPAKAAPPVRAQSTPAKTEAPMVKSAPKVVTPPAAEQPASAKADKAASDKAKPQPRDKMSQSKPPAGKGAPATAKVLGCNRAAARPSGCHPWRERGDCLSQSFRAAPVQKSSL